MRDEISFVGKPGKKELEKAENIEVVQVKEVPGKFSKRISRFALDEGEMHALYLCKKLNINTFLTDDLDARDAGKKLKMDVHGSVGIIARGYKNGVIDLKEAEDALIYLYKSSNLFVAKAIIDKVIEEIRKYEH